MPENKNVNQPRNEAGKSEYQADKDQFQPNKPPANPQMSGTGSTKTPSQNQPSSEKKNPQSGIK